MQAVRHRLRFVTGVNLTARTYGSGFYGDGTYGEQASDALSAAVYLLIPWPGGFLSDPSWIYREGDVLPQFRATVQADDGPLDLTGVATAMLVLAPSDGAVTITPRQFPLTVEHTDGLFWLTRSWQVGDLTPPGTYRTAVVLTYTSSRRLTIPVDDRHNFVITPNSAFKLDKRWDVARWDESVWETDEVSWT